MNNKTSQKILMPIVLGKVEACLAECLSDKNDTALGCRK